MGLTFLEKREAGLVDDQKNICQNSMSVATIMAFNIWIVWTAEPETQGV